MTISTTASRISYNGNGVTTVFSFPYRFLANGDVVVVELSAAGVETIKTLTTDYTLTGAGDDAGGSVTMLVAPASGTRLTIYRDTDVTQEVDYISGDAFPAETHERALDRLTMVVQETNTTLSRTLKIPVTSTADTEITFTAGEFLAINQDGDAIITTPGAPGATVPVSTFMETLLDDTTAGAARTTLGAGAVGSTLFTAATAADGRSTLSAAASGANSDITSLSGVTAIAGAASGAALSSVTSINGGALAGLKNPLINPAFWINQELPATNADDTYAHDGWYALTQTGTIAISTLTDQENTTPFMARLTQSQAVAQRMGYAQIIKGQDCKHLRGQQVTFRFGRTRLSSSANVRIAVLEWTGTEDSVTSDVVLDWTSASYTAGGFFLAANLTVSAVVQQALTAATLTTGSSVTATLGSSFNNLIVFAWTEATVAQNVTFDLAKAQIETGALASNFEQRPFGLDMTLCQRYYWKTYNLGTTPLTATTTGSLRTFSDGAGNGAFYVPFPVEFHATPTLTFGNPNSGASGSWRTSGGADITPTASGTGTRAAGFTFVGAGASNSLFGHIIAAARL